MLSSSRVFLAPKGIASHFSRVASSRPQLLSSFSRFAFSSSSKDEPAAVFNKVAFLGAGKMAQAMITPLISTGLMPAERISAFDVSCTTLKHVKEMNEGIVVAESIPDLVDDADLIVCAVKPQNLDSTFYQEFTSGNIRSDATLLSIVAGKPIQSFLTGAAPKLTKVARSMPNTPAQIGKGVTVWSCTPNVTTEERGRIKQVLDCFGKTIFVDDENFIDMSTSISGSGPAYIYMLMEAMIDAGVHMGFSRDTAQTLVHHTLLGSTLYAMESGEHPAILRNSVTSPAGTTASAMYELENGKFRTVIKDAVWACYRRSLEMGGHDSNVGPGRVSMPLPSFLPPSPSGSSPSSMMSTTHHPIEAPTGEMEIDENGSSDDHDEKMTKK